MSLKQERIVMLVSISRRICPCGISITQRRYQNRIEIFSSTKKKENHFAPLKVGKQKRQKKKKRERQSVDWITANQTNTK